MCVTVTTALFTIQPGDLNFHFRFNKLQEVFDITREQCKLEREHRRALTPFFYMYFKQIVRGETSGIQFT